MPLCLISLLNLANIPSMSGYQVKRSYIFAPRYFTEFVGYNHFSLCLSFKSSSSSFFAYLKVTMSILLTSRQILFSFKPITSIS